MLGNVNKAATTLCTPLLLLLCFKFDTLRMCTYQTCTIHVHDVTLFKDGCLNGKNNGVVFKNMHFATCFHVHCCINEQAKCIKKFPVFG